MTAQHAQRQGKAAARNVAASLGHRARKPYKHRDLGFAVDLGGWQAVANPLHIPISGLPANIVTRAYHLYALPANRLRVADVACFGSIGEGANGPETSSWMNGTRAAF